MSAAKAFLKFVAFIGEELMDLFDYGKNVAQGQEPDPEFEKELTGRMIRKASDAQMMKELGIE